MKERLIITKREDTVISSTFQEDEMIQVSIEKRNESILLDNIYLAKVKNIVKNIRAAFVEITDGRMCYLPLENNEIPLFATPKKNNTIHVGDTLVVQVIKENVKTKAPYVTTNFGFTGKYVVLTHGTCKLGVSKKISSEEERLRLKHILNAYKNNQFGLIARTNAEGASFDQISKEIQVLIALYQNVVEFGIHKSRFSCIYHAPKGYLCTIRDSISHNLKEILTDDANIYQEIKEYLHCYQIEDLNKLRLYEDSSLSLNRLYGIETKLQKAMHKQVWLNSGGTLVIEPTEALTVIDVNTGKAIKGNRKMQATFKKINLEAAVEIAKQIRLRNLSGIIIIDFIDLESETDRKALLSLLEKLLNKDPVKTILIDMTPLGLVEITRKKVRKPLHEQLKNSII